MSENLFITLIFQRVVKRNGESHISPISCLKNILSIDSWKVLRAARWWFELQWMSGSGNPYQKKPSAFPKTVTIFSAEAGFEFQPCLKHTHIHTQIYTHTRLCGDTSRTDL